MKKTRLKIKLQSIQTRDEAEAIVNEIAITTINLLRHSNNMDRELEEVRRGYQCGLTQFTETLKEKTELLRAWAEANPTEFPKDKKSIKFVSGTLGFRTGTPKLALLNRKWSWDRVLKAIMSLGMADQFIRTKEEVDKDAILSSAAQNPDKDGATLACAAFGTKVIQEESFFVDPTLTEVETRQAVAAPDKEAA
jgi:phage host-nuclease inhibitor protein Gam